MSGHLAVDGVAGVKNLSDDILMPPTIYDMTSSLYADLISQFAVISFKKCKNCKTWCSRVFSIN